MSRSTKLLKYTGRFTVLTLLSLAAISIGFSQTAEVEPPPPDIAQIETDITEFQGYFRNRFPTVSVGDFTHGVYALPQYSEQKTAYGFLNAIPPHEHTLPDARRGLNRTIVTPVNTQVRLADCLARYPGGQAFPYFNVNINKVMTLEFAINDCLVAFGQAALENGSDAILSLAAAYMWEYRGKARSVNFSQPEMRRIYEKGRTLYWSRRGQNNFSCASCHVDNAGNRIRGNPLGAALGQSNRFPMFSPQRIADLESRFRAALSDKWLSLHGQYSRCYIRSGAAPLPEQHPDYIALETYQSIMDTELPLKAPVFDQ